MATGYVLCEPDQAAEVVRLRGEVAAKEVEAAKADSWRQAAESYRAERDAAREQWNKWQAAAMRVSDYSKKLEAEIEKWNSLHIQVVAQRDAALRRVEEARGLLDRVQWRGSGSSGYARFCPACDGESTNGHRDDCALAAWLAASGEGA